MSSPDPRLDRLLARLRATGPSAGPPLAALLGVSQSTFSRLVGRADDSLLVVGTTRARVYAARRPIAGVAAPVPVYALPAHPGPARHLVDLHPVAPQGFWVGARDASLDSGFVPDLPWFLHDLRPAGFLGRLLPQLHPSEGYPPDVRRWQGDHVLHYLTQYAWDAPGQLVVGQHALEQVLSAALAAKPAVPALGRAQAWARRAADVLATGSAGSSAQGEHPKFLATVLRDEGPCPVLVKFSPPMTQGPVARRIADLLRAEHHCLGALREADHDAASSTLLTANDRTFLEVERFDRTPHGGRRGVISLEALDAWHVGALPGWVPCARALHTAGVIDTASVDRIRWRHLFGQLVANTDMHGGNLSLWCDDLQVGGVAPTYDMLPMRFAPRAQEVVAQPVQLPVPSPDQADLWPTVLPAARDAWTRVAADDRVSDDFREIARHHLSHLERLEAAVRWLPLTDSEAT